jgi:hypothetical protein
MKRQDIFKRLGAAKLLWAECVRDQDGLYNYIKYTTCK